MIRIIEGHALTELATLDPESVQCVVTSPPYYALRDYGSDPVLWPTVDYKPMPGLDPVSIPPGEASLGLEDTIESYVGHVVLIFRAVYRCLKSDGTLWLNLGDSYARQAGDDSKKTQMRSIPDRQTCCEMATVKRAAINRQAVLSRKI